jgi:Family of unknown function (DUF6165)
LILLPASFGELFDRITILQIKAERIDEAKRANVAKELGLLLNVADEVLAGRESCDDLVRQLKSVNGELWDIEDGKRDCERRQIFDDRFIRLARAVYIKNDQRAAIKRRINEVLGSGIVEEKSYDSY